MSTLLPLTIEKPAAGGRMIARHDGQIVLVSGAIPGERVRARVQQVRGGVVYAEVVDIDEASPDRREPWTDPACGGTVFAHVAYPRQLLLKGEIVADAFTRIGRLPLAEAVAVRPSPERGYRMRARLHVRGSRLGFFREATHEVCEAGQTGQLLPETVAVLGRIRERLQHAGVRAVREIEVSENVPASDRALQVELAPGTVPREHGRIARACEVEGVTGLVVTRPEAPQFVTGRGRPHVSDTLAVECEGRSATLVLRRHVSAFFQGNRFLLEPLVHTVVRHVPPGALLDLYAGAGLFGLAWVVLERGTLVAVEGDRQAAEDLRANARPFGGAVEVAATAVEAYLARRPGAIEATILVDPPRTGMSKEAAAALAAAGAPRIVYVSCDVATLARDARRLADQGYAPTHVEAFDLFPNTAHVETLVVLDRAGGR
jgi:23S rRNA (uracil1939-C5)-methyltransferase